jgi:hypothetical protein
MRKRRRCPLTLHRLRDPGGLDFADRIGSRVDVGLHARVRGWLPKRSLYQMTVVHARLVLLIQRQPPGRVHVQHPDETLDHMLVQVRAVAQVVTTRYRSRWSGL